MGEAFLQALHDDFAEHGETAIQAVRAEKPDQYLKVIASILPKEMNLNVNDAESMTDEQIIERLRKLNELLGPVLGSHGNGVVGERTIPPTTH